MASSALDGLSTNAAMRAPLLLSGQNLKSSSKMTLEILKLLSIIFKVSLKGVSSTS